jgi:poly(A) polymerase
MEDLKKILTDARIIPALSDLLQHGAECWLVGGTLRDWLLGRPVKDFDIATPKDPSDLAMRFAERVGGKWFLMDQQRRQSRVVLRGEGITCDFAPFRAPDLKGDLRMRDFTVNALALPLAGEFSEKLLDVVGGREDLALKRLRACSEWVFFDDPLRVLKGVRHCAELGFRLEEETRRQMARAAGLLDRVAPERIRAEVAAIFSAPSPADHLPLLHSLGLDGKLFGPSQVEEGFDRGVQLAARMEKITRNLAADDAAAALLDEELEAGLSRRTLLTFAAFLRGYAPQDPAGLSASLRLGAKAVTALPALAALPRNRAAEIAALPDTPRGRALWAASLGAGAVNSLMFISLFKKESPEEAAAEVLPLLHDVIDCTRGGRIPDLIDGRWVRENLGLGEGPEVGSVLEMLRREEIAGRVKSAHEARKFLKSLAKKIVDNETGGTL